MNKIKAIIVDDMPLAIASLQADIEDLDMNIEIVGTAGGVMEAAKLIKTAHPDLLFLDVHMEDGDGFDLLEIIDQQAVIFTTASKDFAIKAFQFSAIDHLLKPIDPALLKAAIKKYETAKQESLEVINKGGSLALNTQEEIRLVSIENIIRLEAMGNYTTFYIQGQDKILVTKTMKDFVSVLPDFFLRVHQSHLVNKNFIKSYVKTEGGYLLLKNEMIVPVSVRKKPFVIEAISKK